MQNETEEVLFAGYYYVPIFDSQYVNKDHEMLQLYSKSKYKTEYKQHLSTILCSPDHPLGKIFTKLCATITDQCKEARKRSLISEDFFPIINNLRDWISKIHTSVITSFSIYKDIPDLQDFITNLCISKCYLFILELYKKKYTEEDKHFKIKINDLNRVVTPEFLQINEQFRLQMHGEEEDSFVFSSGAVNLLQQISELQNVTDKISCLVATVQLICNSIKNYINGLGSKNDVTISADDLLPMFTYVIIKSNIDFVYSQLKFILDFSDDSAVFGQTGYCLSMFQSSLVIFREKSKVTVIKEYLKTLKLPDAPPEVDISDTDVPESPSMSRSTSVDSIPDSPMTPGRSPSRSSFSQIFNTQTETTQVEFNRLFGPNEGTPIHRIYNLRYLLILQGYQCSYKQLRNRGVLFSSEEGLHFANANIRTFLRWEDIFSLRKIKFAIFDNSIEAVVKVEDQFVLHKFIGIENRNVVYTELFKIHMLKQSKMTIPCVLVVDVEGIEVEDEEEFLMYKNGVLEKYDCTTAEEAAIFTALLTHITYGDFNGNVHKPGWMVRQNLRNKLIPASYRSVAKFPEELFLSEYKLLSFMSRANCCMYFVQKAREIATKMMLAYKIDVFFVRESVSPQKTKPVMLGLNKEEILRIEIDTLAAFQHYRLENLTKWEAKGTGLTLEFSEGKVMYDDKYQCTSPNVVDIAICIDKLKE